MSKNESQFSKIQKCRVKYGSVHSRFLKIYISYSVTKILEPSVYSTLSFTREFSKTVSHKPRSTSYLFTQKRKKVICAFGIPNSFRILEKCRILNLSVEKKTLSTALGFEPRSFDCRSTALTTELDRRPASLSPQEDFFISPSGSALRL